MYVWSPGSSKLQLHVADIRQGIVVIRLTFDEAKRYIKLFGFPHRTQRIEVNGAIANRSGLRNELLRQPSVVAAPSELRPDVKPLHFCDGVLKRAQRGATSGGVALEEQIKTSLWLRTATRQP